MKPSDTYSYVARAALQPDFVSLLQCYQPILGMEAYSLYHYLWAFYDQGRGRYTFSQILNHLNMGTQTFEKALQTLMAMDLVAVYKEEQHHEIVVLSPLARTDFLKNALYRALLIKKIGEPAVELLKDERPLAAKEWQVSFSDVFDGLGEVKAVLQPTDAFHFEAFEQQMKRDGLRFQDQPADTIAIYQLAQERSWNWFQAYQVAKETAVDQLISTDRMAKKQSASETQQPVAGLTPQEQALVRECKGRKTSEFFGLLKSGKKAAVTASEKKCLWALADLGLLDEVINVIVVYTLNRLDSANLNETFAMKVGNDFSYRGVTTAEQAVEALRTFQQGKSKPKAASSARPSAPSSIPSWSNPDYKDETSAEDLAELEKIQQEILAQLEKGE